MRYAFYRLTSPILDRIPDISHQPKGRVVSIGLAASLIFHLLLLLLAVGFGMILPEHGLLHFTKPKPKLEEIELTIVPPEPELAVTPSTPFIESRGLTPADKPADKPAFESDADMHAASKVPGTGAVPLPTQQGEKVPDVANFESAPLSLAKLSKPIPEAAPPTPPKPAEPEPPKPPQPESPTEQMPPPPTDLKTVPKPAEDQIAISVKPPDKVTPTTSVEPKPRFRASIPTAREITPPTPPQPAATERSLPEEKTAVDGNILNLDEATAVDSVATPLGKYIGNMLKGVRSRWKYYVRSPSGGLVYPLGSVKVEFSIDRRGKISVERSMQNTSSPSFATACERALMDTELPPPAKGLFDDFPEQKYTDTVNFVLH